ncbi:MAG: aminopeptidase [Candidatus Nezhaarchaeota archaeon]|nr:aminopeptidase [Candidatus Nezhaarchaeota archaeon]
MRVLEELKEKLRKAAEMVVKTCLGVRAGEKFLVITDTESEVIGRAIAESGWEVGAETILVVMRPRTRHGEEPPEPIAVMWPKADVFVAPTKYSLTHTQARKRATEMGARGATMPMITLDIFIEGMSVDYNMVKSNCDRLLKALRGSREIRVTSPLGTDIKFLVEGREFIADTGILIERGSFGNLPAGEVFVAPIEGTANGVVVFDGAIAGVGTLKVPVKVLIRDGLAVEFEGEDEAQRLKQLLSSVGMKEAFNVAEFGIGTNPGAKIVGNILMDEKVYGTIHIAFGDNSTIGGRIKAGIHLDGIVTKPTVYVDDKMIMKDGVWLI